MGGSRYGKFDKRIYTDLASDHPIDLTRYQVAILNAIQDVYLDASVTVACM